MPLFNKLRKTQIKTEGMKRYLLYAIGEIVLVVVGILIALQISNWSEAKKERGREQVYLKNIRHDLVATAKELERIIERRKKIGEAAEEVVAHFEGKPITDWNAFNKNLVTVYEWSRFFPIDNTFREMSSSGNLSLLSNDSIKNGLLELDEHFNHLKRTEDHFRYDTEKCLYESLYGYGDVRKMADDYYYQSSGGKDGKPESFDGTDFDKILKDVRQKNGFVFATMYMPGLVLTSERLKARCDKLIALINNDLAR